MLGYLITSISKFARNLNDTKLLVLLGILTGLFSNAVSFTSHVTVGIIPMVYLAVMQYENSKGVKCSNAY